MVERRAVGSLAVTLVSLAVFAPPVMAGDRPSIHLEAPGIIVQAGRKVTIYTFPPVGFDLNQAAGGWPYPYPLYPYPHPAFPPLSAYPSFSAPTPYVPLGSGLQAPPLESRGIELKPGGRIVIDVEPEDADVFVDGTLVTVKTEHGYSIGLLAGRHRVDIQRQGFLPWSQQIEVPGGGGLLLKVQLLERESR